MSSSTGSEINEDDVELRPFTAEEAERMISRRRVSIPEATGDLDEAALQRFAERMQNSGRWTHGFIDLAIIEADRCVGDIQARGTGSGTFPPGTVEIGIDRNSRPIRLDCEARWQRRRIHHARRTEPLHGRKEMATSRPGTIYSDPTLLRQTTDPVVRDSTTCFNRRLGGFREWTEVEEGGES